MLYKNEILDSDQLSESKEVLVKILIFNVCMQIRDILVAIVGSEYARGI